MEGWIGWRGQRQSEEERQRDYVDDGNEEENLGEKIVERD